MFNWQSARESNQKDEIAELTRKAQIEALRGKNATKYIADANANYWDYAGKVGSGGAAQQIATNAEPFITALRNQGAAGVAGIQGGTDRAVAGIQGGTARDVAGIQGGTAMGVANTNAEADKYGYNKNFEGVKTRSDSDREVGKYSADSAAGSSKYGADRRYAGDLAGAYAGVESSRLASDAAIKRAQLEYGVPTPNRAQKPVPVAAQGQSGASGGVSPMSPLRRMLGQAVSDFPITGVGGPATLGQVSDYLTKTEITARDYWDLVEQAKAAGEPDPRGTVDALMKEKKWSIAGR